jgi:hypothetical protein
LKHYAEVKADNEKQKYDLWIENEGIMLDNKVYNKAQLSEQLSAKVGIVICLLIALLPVMLMYICSLILG